MASAGLLALLDDIAALTSLAGKKAAGIVGDDLALNAKGLVGIDPARELPIVWEVAKGSAKNKAFLIPAALALSLVAPWSIIPLLMLGGAFLCYEGMEKIIHGIQHIKDQPDIEDIIPPHGSNMEKEKIRGAIKTDLILSAEIIVVSLGVMAASPLMTKAIALCAIGAAMTIGVYGLVGGLVKLDDVGLHMASKKGNGALSQALRFMGRGIVQGVPPLMKTISALGTVAMFAVGGGIIAHGIPTLHHTIESLVHMLPTVPVLPAVAEIILTAVGGMVTGLAVIPVIEALKKIVNSRLFRACFRKRVKPEKNGGTQGLD